MKKLSRTIGLSLCTLGWHPRPFAKAPAPDCASPEDYRFSPRGARYSCRRCGAAGRLDVHGNLDTDGGGAATRVAV